MEPRAGVFYRELPKVELHAHLNGSVSSHTIEKLIGRKPHLNVKHDMTAIRSGQRRTLDECFQVFKVIHQLVDTEEDILMVAKDVINEFAADGVKYLELRSTPREEVKTGLTKRRYVETVLEAVQQCKNEGVDIDVRFLVAVDRRNGAEVAMQTVKLAEEFMLSTDGLVVGLDLSGDPTVPSQLEETGLLLTLPPDRIGHGTFLHPEVGGCQTLVDKVVEHNIPLDLSQEYQLAASTFGLTPEDVWKLSQQAIDCTFAPENVKQQLKQRWIDLRPHVLQ
ncbi:hypothetical protein CRUP_001726 [Coryphaenoides rupestris]|nr:hypothetical protein CRUP_001726 [Coryphaenoides rupestris]